MKLGSLFDGSGGFPLAGLMNGITPVWASEIEPYPIAVTRSRFPGTKHYGNVCDINGAEVEPVDIITAGSPCQDLSVAGLRAGIYQGKRSNLFFESIRIVKEMRAATNGKYPRYFVWENVPGAFSSDKGGAFQAVLEAVCSVKEPSVSIPQPKGADGTDKSVWLKAGNIVGNGYSVAWRVFDAQYWGVPQRRARIYLVADFDSERAAEILFKSDSLRGNMQSGNAAKKEVAAGAVGGVDGSVGTECLTPLDYQNKRIYPANGVYPCLPSIAEGSGQNAQAVLCDTLCFDGTQITSPQNGNNPQWNDPCHPLAATAYTPAVILKERAGCEGGGKGALCAEDTTFTLATSPDMAVCFDRATFNQGINAGYDFEVSEKGVVSTIVAKGPSGVCYDARGNGDGNIVPTITGDHEGRITDYTAVAIENAKPPRRYIIRRLMPVECARLQGFPDRWGELAPYDGDDAFWEQVRKTHAEINGKAYKPTKNLKAWYDKLHNDGAEYKMWGNGIALPCAEFIMWAIMDDIAAERITQ